MRPTREITHVITGLDVGGAEWTLTRLATRLHDRGWRTRVVCLQRPGKLAARLEASGVKVLSLGMRAGASSPLALGRLVGLFRRSNTNLVQTWLYHADVLGTLAARLARTPRVVWNIRTSAVDMRLYGPASGLVRWTAARMSAMPDAIVVNSTAGRIAHEALGFRPRRWQTIPNGVDTHVFRPDAGARAAVRRSLQLGDAVTVVGVIARFDPIKGHELWIHAAGQLALAFPEIRFVFVGRGVSGNSPELNRWIAEAGLSDRVHLLGERDDVAAVATAMDILVMPSLAEGFPNVVAEAMSCEVPCVVTNAGDAATLVGETGWVAPPGDAAALAAACRQALDVSQEGRRARGRAARARIEATYSLEAMTVSYEAFYTALLADNGR